MTDRDRNRLRDDLLRYEYLYRGQPDAYREGVERTLRAVDRIERDEDHAGRTR
jgi:hypothetical protein